MLKKEVGLVAIIITLTLFFVSQLMKFYLNDLKTSIPLINVFFITTIKPLAFWLALIWLFPSLILFLLVIRDHSKPKGIDDTYFYKSLLSFVHLSSILLGIYLLAWIWVILLLYSIIFLKFELIPSFIISSIIVVVFVFVIDALIQKHLKIRYYNIFHWIK